LPSSEVTPWLFQDFKVSYRICAFAAQSLCWLLHANVDPIRVRSSRLGPNACSLIQS
jgi:hypothetical protein